MHRIQQQHTKTFGSSHFQCVPILTHFLINDLQGQLMSLFLNEAWKVGNLLTSAIRALRGNSCDSQRQVSMVQKSDLRDMERLAPPVVGPASSYCAHGDFPAKQLHES